MKTRITSLTAVTILLASIITLTVPPEAFAMPGPDDDIDRIAVEQFNENSYTILPAANPVFLKPHAGTLFVIEHTTQITTLAGDGDPTCEPSINSLGPPGMVWALVDSNGNLALYIVDVNESLKVTFTDSSTAANPVATGNTIANMLSGTGPYTWAEYLGPMGAAGDGVFNAGVTIPQLATLGNQWGFFTCGVDGYLLVPGQQPSFQQETFRVELPVGGEIISINTSALVIAGLMTNGMMLVPILGAAATAGTVFTVLRHLRKED